MKIDLKVFLIILTLFLIYASYEVLWQTDIIGFADRTLVKAHHRQCTKDEECVPFKDACGIACPEAVNRTYLPTLNFKRKKLCKDHLGGHLFSAFFVQRTYAQSTDCPYRPVCLGNLCTMLK